MAIILFDVDGTLTPSGDKIQPNMVDILNVIVDVIENNEQYG